MFLPKPSHPSCPSRLRLNRPRTIYDAELESSYGALDVEGRTVVDIGADCGSSAWYFLQKGATKVICYEADEDQYQELIKNCRGDNRVEPHRRWNGESVDGDVLKVDCEGCELALTGEFFVKFKHFAIAIHPYMYPTHTYRRIRDLLTGNGAILTVVTPDSQEEMYVRP